MTNGFLSYILTNIPNFQLILVHINRLSPTYGFQVHSIWPKPNLFSFSSKQPFLYRSQSLLIKRHKIWVDFIKVAVNYHGLLPRILLFNHQEILVTHLRDTNITSLFSPLGLMSRLVVFRIGEYSVAIYLWPLLLNVHPTCFLFLPSLLKHSSLMTTAEQNFIF